MAILELTREQALRQLGLALFGRGWKPTEQNIEQLLKAISSCKSIAFLFDHFGLTNGHCCGVHQMARSSSKSVREVGALLQCDLRRLRSSYQNHGES